MAAIVLTQKNKMLVTKPRCHRGGGHRMDGGERRVDLSAALPGVWRRGLPRAGRHEVQAGLPALRAHQDRVKAPLLSSRSHSSGAVLLPVFLKHASCRCEVVLCNGFISARHAACQPNAPSTNRPLTGQVCKA